MGQVRILNKIEEYLKQTSPDQTERLRTKLKRGHCFAFALIMAAMSAIDALEWWTEGLIALNNWDARLDTLNQKLNLPKAHGSCTLESFLIRALNYIIPHQFMTDKNFNLIPDSQYNILSPLLQHFEITDLKKNLQKIGGRKLLGGNFSSKQLDALFQESFIEGKICLIHNVNHGICVIYKNATWYVYDPNYLHDCKQNMLKACSSKQTMLAEITKILGPALGIEVAWFQNSTNIDCPNWDNFTYQLSFQDAVSLLADDGFTNICRHCPDSLPNFLNIMLNQLPGKDILYKQLFRCASDGFSNLFMLMVGAAIYFEDVKPLLFRDGTAQDILKILPGRTAAGSNFGFLIKYHETHHATRSILKIASQSSQAPDIFVHCLQEKNLKGHSGLAQVLHYAPQELHFILSQANRSFLLPDVLLECLLELDKKSGESVFHLLLKKAHSCLPLVLTILLKSKLMSRHAAPLFLALSKDHVSALETIKKEAGGYLAAILPLVAKSYILDMNNFKQLSLILENAQNGTMQVELLNTILKKSRCFTLDIITCLPNNYCHKRELAANVIVELITLANSPLKVLAILREIIRNNNYDFLKKRLAFTTLFGEQTNSSRQWSPIWLMIIKTGMDKITAMVDKEFKQDHGVLNQLATLLSESGFQFLLKPASARFSP